MPQSDSATSATATSDASGARHVFVYGTLRRGGGNDIARLAKSVPPPRFVADACIAGALYDFGRYPGAVLGGASTVRGEVYRIAPELEAVLDVLEEVRPDGSGEYVKREVQVETGRGPLLCLVYEIHPDRIAGRQVIPSGDWMA